MFHRPIQSSDRVVILGDAIALGGNRNHGFITRLREAEGCQDTPWFVIGRTADRWAQSQERLLSEVLPLEPSILIVMLGTNDVWHQSRGHVLEFGATQQLIREFSSLFFSKCPQAELVLTTPWLIGEKADGTNSADRDLEALSATIRELIAGLRSTGSTSTDSTAPPSHKLSLLDLRETALNFLKSNNTQQKPHSLLTIDGIQPNRFGHQFLAETLADFFSLSLPTPQTENLRHVVLLKFKTDTAPAKVREVLLAFQSLGQKIDVIQAIESGTNNSPEGLDQGYTHAFNLTFSSATDRDLYLHHPAHVAFTELAIPAIEQVCVFDYWAQPHPTCRT
jgi:lysophospholipase L1-like esterase